MPDWENPDVNGINKEQPRAYGFLAEEKANNPMIRSLLIKTNTIDHAK